MIINIGGGGNVGYVLNVSTSAGATVTATKDSKSYTKTSDNSGVATFTKLSKGIWTITATKGSSTKTTNVNMQGDCSITIVLNSVPEFRYSGDCIVYDANNADITSNPETQGDWKIKFLTSGTLTFTKLNGADENGVEKIDIFCVGGGGNGASSGGGGGGGRTVTARDKSVSIGDYNIIIGGPCGTSSFGNLATAEGGYSAVNESGGAGGSGGGAGGRNGGSNGSDGTDWTPIYGYVGGAGLDESTGTQEFHELTGELYAGGGGGGRMQGAVEPQQGMGGAGGGGNGADTVDGAGYSGRVNTGGGGGGGGGSAGTGGSGVVIIRNKR